MRKKNYNKESFNKSIIGTLRKQENMILSNSMAIRLLYIVNIVGFGMLIILLKGL